MEILFIEIKNVANKIFVNVKFEIKMNDENVINGTHHLKLDEVMYKRMTFEQIENIITSEVFATMYKEHTERVVKNSF